MVKRKSKKIIEEFSSENEEDFTYNYCRKCMKKKHKINFYPTHDEYLDSNGLFSICKDCCNSIFQEHYEKSTDLEDTILKMCRMLNMKYDERALESAKAQYKSDRFSFNSFFGIYKARLLAVNRDSMREAPDGLILTYQDNPIVSYVGEKVQDEDFPEAEERKHFWGTDDKNKLEFLESEYGKFKRTLKETAHAGTVLLRLICLKMWDIEEARKNNKDVDNDTKHLMALMDKLAISPHLTNSASVGKNADTFGTWIKEIEELTPAEYIKDKSIYADVDDVEEYAEKFITSPLRSLITGVREFSIGDEELQDGGDE